MFALYEVVKLRVQKAPNLPAGTQGTILIIYNEPGLPLAYEVEFLDDLGSTLSIMTLKEQEIEKIDHLAK